jgi:hypothetical protein
VVSRGRVGVAQINETKKPQPGLLSANQTAPVKPREKDYETGGGCGRVGVWFPRVSLTDTAKAGGDVREKTDRPSAGAAARVGSALRSRGGERAGGDGASALSRGGGGGGGGGGGSLLRRRWPLGAGGVRGEREPEQRERLVELRLAAVVGKRWRALGLRFAVPRPDPEEEDGRAVVIVTDLEVVDARARRVLGLLRQLVRQLVEPATQR